MSTKSFSTMPEAFDFTSTLVIGSIFPVATTDRATSPRVTLASRLASIVVLVASLASATPATTTSMTTPSASHSQNRFPFRDAATKILQGEKKNRRARLRYGRKNQAPKLRRKPLLAVTRVA